MTTHLSCRLPWHDFGWNGKVCKSPSSNSSCISHEYVRESRDVQEEVNNSGEKISDLPIDLRPPCSQSACTFSKEGYKITHHDPVPGRDLGETEEMLPPFSFTCAPFRRMLKGEDEEGTWKTDPETQEENLNDFFSELEPGKSLVFFYVNASPFHDLQTGNSGRLLVGAGRISEIGDQKYFADGEHPVWYRRVSHQFSEEGVRLPYYEYSEDKDVTDVDEDILCWVPREAKPYFSYTAEHVNDDIAVGTVERLIESVQTIIDNRRNTEYWRNRLEWLNRVLGELWRNRGAYPSIGAVLEHMGNQHGTIYQKKVLAEKAERGEDPLKYIISVLNNETEPEMFQKAFSKARKRWRSKSDSEKNLLKILCRFNLTIQQVSRIADKKNREACGMELDDQEIIDNPYLLCEKDEGNEESQPIRFETIDRGIFPEEDYLNFNYGFDNFLEEDQRRIRALLVSVLKREKEKGDTLLPLQDAISIGEGLLPESRRVLPEIEKIIDNRDFYENSLVFDNKNSTYYIALPRLRNMENEISDQIKKLIRKDWGKSEINWRKRVNKSLEGVPVLKGEFEEKAREEKAKCLENIFRSRFSVLTGHAGTGKTKTLGILTEALREIEGKKSILLLAPTGKARVRLEKATNLESETIHQFLTRLGWIDTSTYRLKEDGGGTEGASTVIVDEASMIPLDLMATLFRALDFNRIRRVVVAGDPNQLPPIGPGRPFVDVISWLESEAPERCLNALSISVRHQKDEEKDALKLAEAYLRDNSSPADDEIFSKVAKEKLEGDLEVDFWKDSDQLHEILLEKMGELIGDEKISSEKLNRNLDPKKGGSPDKWQILSPTRQGPYGIADINRWIQEEAHESRIKVARAEKKQPDPFANQHFVKGDKIVQTTNEKRTAKKGEEYKQGYVANGEVGLIRKTNKSWKGRKKDSIDILFSTQQGVNYRYWRGEDLDEKLELAYAMTVHKAQGSDFNIVFLILPQKAPTLSKELLYTGLTRFKNKLVLLLERDINPLIQLRDPKESEIGKRNTKLFELTARPETIKPPFPGKLIHVTKEGELVRSKSEVIIANILSNLGLSYNYEEKLESPDDPEDFRLPDFTVYYEGETFYWEHLGMIDDPQYRREWKRKKKWYEENGYCDNLVISKEDSSGGIDSSEIEQIAREEILEHG